MWVLLFVVACNFLESPWLVQILSMLIPLKEISQMFVGLISPLGVREITVLSDVIALELVSFAGHLWGVCYRHIIVLIILLARTFQH